jgi:hypothetical protein
LHLMIKPVCQIGFVSLLFCVISSNNQFWFVLNNIFFVLVENGCLHYIPGSHKWSLLPITSRHFNDMESIQTVLNDEQRKQFKPTPMLLKVWIQKKFPYFSMQFHLFCWKLWLIERRGMFSSCFDSSWILWK